MRATRRMTAPHHFKYDPSVEADCITWTDMTEQVPARSAWVQPYWAAVEPHLGGLYRHAEVSSGNNDPTSCLHQATSPIMMSGLQGSDNSQQQQHLKLAPRSPSAAADDNDLQQDAWSGEGSSEEDASHSRTGALKRKRPISVSCETCKARKVKCGREQPHCSWCQRNSTPCLYLPRKKPGLRAGYGRQLEARLDKLESIIAQQQEQLDHLSSRSGASAAVESPQEVKVFHNPCVLQGHQTPHVPRPETALFIQKSNTFPPQESVPPAYAASIPHVKSLPVHGTYTTQSDDLQSRASFPPSVLTQNPISQFGPAFVAGSSAEEDADFPPYDLLYGLVDLYFKHVNVWCPILHRQSTLNSLFGDKSLDDADRIILHAVVATTLKFSTDQRLTPEKRERYHRISKEKVLLHGIENSSVKSLQALVILSLDVVGCSNGPPGWNLLALITRSIVQLGLSMESQSPLVSPQIASIYTLRAMVLPDPKDWIEEESRRRLFWMIYLLDRYATVATAFEFALDERDIDRRLPCKDELFNRNLPVETRWFQTPSRSDFSMDRPENLGPFAYYIEILGLLSKVHNFLKRPVDITSLSDVEQWQGEYRGLDTAIEQWRYHLPPEYGNSARMFSGSGAGKILDSGLVMLHAAFLTTVIRLHSSAAYPTHRSPIFAPSFSASQRCLSAVESIVALCASVRENGLLTKLGPPFAFSLWVAARVLLVHGSTIDHRVDTSIHLLVSTLQEIGQYWEVGTRYAKLLSRVLHEYQESQQTPAGANGERITPSTVKILADMRRCAFDLDFLISRLPKVQSGAMRTAATVTPARTPGPSELEYLDVFDFFNMPRLPVLMDGTMAGSLAPDRPMHMGDGHAGVCGNMSGNESNITNYMVDASSDWFIKAAS